MCTATRELASDGNQNTGQLREWRAARRKFCTTLDGRSRSGAPPSWGWGCKGEWGARQHRHSHLDVPVGKLTACALAPWRSSWPRSSWRAARRGPPTCLSAPERRCACRPRADRAASQAARTQVRVRPGRYACLQTDADAQELAASGTASTSAVRALVAKPQSAHAPLRVVDQEPRHRSTPAATIASAAGRSCITSSAWTLTTRYPARARARSRRSSAAARPS